MAINFPTSLDTLTNPTASDPLNSPAHATQHANINDIGEATEAKIGIGSETAASASEDEVLIRNATAGTTVWDLPTQMKLTAAPASDHTAYGIKITLTAHDTQAFGDVCFINSDGEAALIDADAIASMSAIVMCADASISADASGTYLLMGIARDDTWAWTVGGLIYGSVTGTTGNTLTQTAPSGADDVIQVLGVATHADRMYFNPSLSQVEHT